MLITKDGQIIDGTIVNDVYGINTAFGPFTLEARKVVGFAGVTRARSACCSPMARFSAAF